LNFPEIRRKFITVDNPDFQKKSVENGKICRSGNTVRKNRSTQDKLFELTHDVTVGFTEGDVAIATFFDMEKAYDKMWHQGLVLKLRNVGLASTTIGLILNFLSNRSISLKINGKEGAPIKLKSGTAQGAILSPLIFNCWVSDIPQPGNQKTRLSQYADDVATWSRMKSVKKCQARLQRYNTRFVNWCKRWRMKLSASKTKVLLFHRKKIRRNGLLIGQKIDQTLITPSKEATFLGIVLDPKLKLQKHHRKIMTELRRRIKLFRNITGSRSRPRCDSRTCLKILNKSIN